MQKTNGGGQNNITPFIQKMMENKEICQHFGLCDFENAYHGTKDLFYLIQHGIEDAVQYIQNNLQHNIQVKSAILTEHGVDFEIKIQNNEYILRINYEKYYIENYVNLLQNVVEYSEYFTPILAYGIDGWALLPKMKSSTKPFNIDKYIEAIRICSNTIHYNGYLYRNWKLDNFQILENDDDWIYVLKDTSISESAKPSLFNMHTPISSITIQNKQLGMIMDKYISNLYNMFKNHETTLNINISEFTFKNIICDNYIALLSVYSEITETKTFEDVEVVRILTHNANYDPTINKLDPVRCLFLFNITSKVYIQ